MLKAPQGKPTLTLPFLDAEMEKILWAAERYPELYPMSREYGKKVKPFVHRFNTPAYAYATPFACELMR